MKYDKDYIAKDSTTDHISEKIGAGFTLIETIIYIALVAFLIGGGVIAAYAVIQGSGRASDAEALQEEGQFVVSGVWLLRGSRFSDPERWCRH